MTPQLFMSSVGVVVAILALGALAGWGWDRYRSAPTTERTAKRLDIILGTFFTTVAIMVSIDLILVTSQFNAYVTQTEPRDAAQEKCDSQTIDVLQIWARVRIDKETAEQVRDDIAVDILGMLSRGEKVPPRRIDDLQNAVLKVTDTRNLLKRNYVEHPLPQCSFNR